MRFYRKAIGIVFWLVITCLLLSACVAGEPATEPMETSQVTVPTVTTVPNEISEPTTEPETESTEESVPEVYAIDMEKLAADAGMWCEVCKDGEVIGLFYQCAFPIQYSFEDIMPADERDVTDISGWIRYYRQDGTVEVILYAGDIIRCTVDGKTEWFLNETRPTYDWLMQNLDRTIQRIHEPIRIDYSVYSEWDYREVQGDGLGEEKTPGPITAQQAEEFLNCVEEQVSALGADAKDVASLADLFLRCTGAVEIMDKQDFDWSMFTTGDAFQSIGLQALMKIKGGYFSWRMDRSYQPAVVYIDGDLAVAYDNNIEIYFRLMDGRWFIADVMRPWPR